MARHLHILGIGGTLMGSLALLAREAGWQVSGSDKALYPPMSEQLAAADISLYEGFEPAQLTGADLVLIGNAGLPRGHPAVEAVLNQGLPYTSGAEWLGREILQGRWVLAAAGTHGKTTTASLLAWILAHAGLAPGFMIGGVPANFQRSARLGSDPFFVVEADEYDTSYFDRRAKFVHYRPRTLIINNLEYDHADIYPDLAAISAQFHLLLRTLPGNGQLVVPAADANVEALLAQGCWTPLTRVGLGSGTANTAEWQAECLQADGSAFILRRAGKVLGQVHWSQLGNHNVCNAVAAVAAASHAGVAPNQALAALESFTGVARRMQLLARNAHCTLYDDFAHHPTAIRATLAGLRANAGREEIIAVIEPRSHTMSLGSLQADLRTCVADADQVFWFQGSNIRWDLPALAAQSPVPAQVFQDPALLLQALQPLLQATPQAQHRHIVFMSNGAFAGIQHQLAALLEAAKP